MPPTAPYGNILRSTGVKTSPVVLKEAEADGYRHASTGRSLVRLVVDKTDFTTSLH